MRKCINTAILLGTVLTICFLCSCAHIETNRYASLDPKNKTIHFKVSGFIASPLTAEGPFPSWSNNLLVKLNDNALISDRGQKTFESGIDFSTQYNEVKSGTIILDQTHKTATIAVKYSDDYLWNRVNGTFPIREEQ